MKVRWMEEGIDGRLDRKMDRRKEKWKINR